MAITEKKTLVIKEGIRKQGGSIKVVSEKMNRTEANTRLHIKQCESMYGFNYRIDGDRFWILKL